MWKLLSFGLRAVTRDFSRRYQSMLAPAMAPEAVNSIRTNLPNRDELLFRTVWALPKLSRIGLAWMIWRSSFPSRLGTKSISSGRGDDVPAAVEPSRFIAGRETDDPGVELASSARLPSDPLAGISRLASLAIAVKYPITFLVFSVLPAPDSPVMRIDWPSRSPTMFCHACSATAYTCGGFSVRRRDL